MNFPYRISILNVRPNADVAELVDAQVSEACSRKGVEVRFFSSAPNLPSLYVSKHSTLNKMLYGGKVVLISNTLPFYGPTHYFEGPSLISPVINDIFIAEKGIDVFRVREYYGDRWSRRPS